MLTKHFVSLAAIVTFLALAPHAANAIVKPNVLFTDGAVLQRDIPVPVWGTADDGEKITVTIANNSATTVAKDGKWMVKLKPMPAGGPYVMTITGAANTVTVNNVDVGEVWVCSGQSNMEFVLKASSTGAAAKLLPADHQYRQFHAGGTWSDTPSAELNAQWYEMEPNTVDWFSAVGYFFGRDLRQDLGVPVGMIEIALSGTVAEAWTSQASIGANPDLKYLLDKYHADVAAYDVQLKAYNDQLPQLNKDYAAAKMTYAAAVDAAKAAGTAPPAAPKPPAPPAGDPHLDGNRVGHLYNGLVMPLAPYAMRGVLWYQGESNVPRAYEYKTLLPTMIADWRKVWNEGDFPFLIVQLPPDGAQVTGPAASAWAELREAQRLTALHGKNIGLAVTTDISDEPDLHPLKKEPVANRLALIARGMVYGEKVDYMGPTLASAQPQGDHITVRFNNTGGGLVADGQVKGFDVAGADKRWYPAIAVIHGDEVSVSSPPVAQPVAVRYGWADFPVTNLKGKNGMGAGPFSTDTWTWLTQPKP